MTVIVVDWPSISVQSARKAHDECRQQGEKYDENRKSADVKSRRAFLKGGAVAAAAGAATLAMPNVVRAQEAVMFKFQSTWPAKDIFHEFAADFVARVNDMGGGRIKLDLLAAGAVAKALEVQDAVIAGTLDGAHGVTAYWYGKHKALFAVRNAARLGLARQPDGRLDEIRRRPGAL